MFDIGITELLIVAVFGLVVLGPEKLPLVFRTIGTLIGRAQNYVSEVKNDIQKQIELEEFDKERNSVLNISDEVSKNFSELEKDLSDSINSQDTLSKSDGKLEKKIGFYIGSPELTWPEENSYIKLRERLLQRKRLLRQSRKRKVLLDCSKKND